MTNGIADVPPVVYKINGIPITHMDDNQLELHIATLRRDRVEPPKKARAAKAPKAPPVEAEEI